MKAKINLNNIIAYIQGNLRYKLWYWKSNYNYSYPLIRYIYLLPLHKIIRKHIREQIEFRLKWMKPECYNQGECVICGCATTALQMASKACDAPCYPEMMDKTHWKKFKQGEIIIDNSGKWKINNQQLIKIE